MTDDPQDDSEVPQYKFAGILTAILAGNVSTLKRSVSPEQILKGLRDAYASDPDTALRRVYDYCIAFGISPRNLERRIDEFFEQPFNSTLVTEQTAITLSSLADVSFDALLHERLLGLGGGREDNIHMAEHAANIVTHLTIEQIRGRSYISPHLRSVAAEELGRVFGNDVGTRALNAWSRVSEPPSPNTNISGLFDTLITNLPTTNLILEKSASSEITCLEGYVPNGLILQVVHGGAPLTKELSDFLGYFLPDSIRIEDWRRVAENARIHSTQENIGFIEGNREKAINAIMRKLVNNRQIEGDAPALAQICSFLRHTKGLSAEEAGQAIGYSRRQITNIETGEEAYYDRTLINAYQREFGFSDDIKSLLLPLVAVANAYGSNALKFAEIFTAIVENRNTGQDVPRTINQFLHDVHLDGIISPQAVQELMNGEAFPSERLSQYLAYFASEQGISFERYKNYVSHTRADGMSRSNAGNIPSEIMLDEDSFSHARLATMRDFAQDKTTAISRMLRLARLTSYHSLYEFDELTGIDWRNLSTMENSIEKLPSAKAIEMIKEKVFGNPGNPTRGLEEDALMRHAAVDAFALRSIETDGANRLYIRQALLLLGHNPSEIVVHDISSGIPHEQRTYIERDNAKLLELVEENILRGRQTTITLLDEYLAPHAKPSPKRDQQISEALGPSNQTQPLEKHTEPEGFTEPDRPITQQDREFANNFLLRALAHENLVRNLPVADASDDAPTSPGNTPAPGSPSPKHRSGK